MSEAPKQTDVGSGDAVQNYLREHPEVRDRLRRSTVNAREAVSLAIDAYGPDILVPMVSDAIMALEAFVTSRCPESEATVVAARTAALKAIGDMVMEAFGPANPSLAAAVGAKRVQRGF